MVPKRTPLTLSTTINVAINATTASGIHTNTITGGGLPGTVYVGDTLQLNFDGTATETGGGGFETIQYAVATSGTAEFTQSITATPAPTSIGDDDITWQDFTDPTLSGSFTAQYDIVLTETGSLNITINTNSIDTNNADNAAEASLVLDTISVEKTRPPTTVETETDLYQNGPATQPEYEGEFKKNPVMWRPSPLGLKEMSDAELDSIATRFARKIINDELPGVFRLSDGRPTAEYVKFLENVFVDTRGDGTNNYYHIWVKQSSTPPTKVQPISIFRQSGAFAGLKQMNDQEIRFTFGERVKIKIMESGIGTYQLRSSTQGSPTATGTWQARGHAVDTRRTFFDDPATQDRATSTLTSLVTTLLISWETLQDSTHSLTLHNIWECTKERSLRCILVTMQLNIPVLTKQNSHKTMKVTSSQTTRILPILETTF